MHAITLIADATKLAKANKLKDNDWFRVEPSKDGTKWQGTCSATYNLVRYEFRLQFEIPATYPSSPIEL